MVPAAGEGVCLWICERRDKYGRDHCTRGGSFSDKELWVAMGVRRDGHDWIDLAAFLDTTVQAPRRTSQSFGGRVAINPERPAGRDAKSSMADDVRVQAGVGFRARKISDGFNVVVLHHVVPEISLRPI